MNNKEMFDIINGDKFGTQEECLEAHEKFFAKFNVTLKNKDGSYKSLYNIFKEASENYELKAKY